jgi:hypothetical protein
MEESTICMEYSLISLLVLSSRECHPMSRSFAACRLTAYAPASIIPE